jgi:hypothetical protein
MSKNEIFLQDAQLAYARAISNLFNCWVHDEDNGCDYDAIGSKQVSIYNSAVLIYQPMGKPDEGWIDNGSILIIPTKESGIKLNEALTNKLKPLFQEVDNKLIDSYNGHVKKFGHWIEVFGPKTDTPDFKKITGIFDTIKFDKGVLKFKWFIKCLWMGPCSYWYPVELINWYKTLPAYERYRYIRYRINRTKLEERISECEKSILDKETSLRILTKTPDLEDLDAKVEELTDNIEREKMYAHSLDISLLKLNESMNHPDVLITDYSEDDKFVEEWYRDNAEKNQFGRCFGECSKDMIAKEISYSHAFPERESSLSGKKRKSESTEVSATKRR